MKNSFDYALPDSSGYFGEYGGSFIPPQLQVIIDEITAAYLEIRHDENFHRELEQAGEHAASITKGQPGVMHGFKSYIRT